MVILKFYKPIVLFTPATVLIIFSICPEELMTRNFAFINDFMLIILWFGFG